MARSSSTILFRVQGVNRGATRNELEQALTAAFAPDERGGTIVISRCTLVPDPTDDTQVALVAFKPQPPRFLRECGSEMPDVTVDDTVVGDLCFDRDFYGLTQLYTPAIGGEVLADIVAVTGLDGHAYGSWKAKGVDGKMWLADFFAQDFPQCRTMIFGYDSKLRSSGIHEIVDYNRQLLEALRQARHKVRKERPIVFVAHSFGGIVVAQSLISADETYHTDPVQHLVYTATSAVLFFGTPHRGLLTEDILSIVDQKDGAERQELVRSIDKTSKELQRQLLRFIEIVSGIRILSFYERKKTKSIVKDADGVPSRSGELIVPVGTDSALLNLPRTLERVYPVDADHSEMVKFSNKHNQSYKTVRSTINEIIQARKDQQSGHPGTPQRMRSPPPPQHPESPPVRPERPQTPPTQKQPPLALPPQAMPITPPPTPPVDPLTPTQKNRRLLRAVTYDDDPTVELMLSRGANINAVNADGDTSLIVAATENLPEMLGLLITHKADTEALNPGGRTALHQAARFGHLACVRLLVAAGAALESTDNDGSQPQGLAKWKGHTAVVDYLARAIADRRNPHTRLHRAVCAQDMERVGELLAEGVDVDTKDCGADQSTALMQACSRGLMRPAKALVESGAGLEIRQRGGRTALHFAARHGHEEIVRLLVNHGAVLSTKDGDGVTPLGLAKWQKHAAAMQMLRNYGAT